MTFEQVWKFNIEGEGTRYVKFGSLEPTLALWAKNNPDKTKQVKICDLEVVDVFVRDGE